MEIAPAFAVSVVWWLGWLEICLHWEVASSGVLCFWNWNPDLGSTPLLAPIKQDKMFTCSMLESLELCINVKLDTKNALGGHVSVNY